MKANLTALAAGLIFGLGLGVSGMTHPSKIVGFLDVTGAWDASLAFVMMGALLVHIVFVRVAMRRASPLFDAKFHLPTRRDVDTKLVLGAALFGVGWGLGGYCPGPALVSAASGSRPALLFALAMAVGMLAQHATPAMKLRFPRRRTGRPHHETSEPPCGSLAVAKGS